MKPRKLPDLTDVAMGARLREMRIRRGLSQEQVGETIGVTFQQIQKYEKGTNRFPTARMLHLADIWGASPTAFLPDGAAPACRYDLDEALVSVRSAIQAVDDAQTAAQHAFQQVRSQLTRIEARLSGQAPDEAPRPPIAATAANSHGLSGRA